MDHPSQPQSQRQLQCQLRCQCGQVQGSVDALESAHHVKCYCRDCQAFAHFLENSSSILDDAGGTDIIQTSPKNITFSAGTEFLSCIKLTESGMLRWYASCCKTPIGNTLPTPQISFIGVIHSCLDDSNPVLNKVMGTVQAILNTDSAQGETKPQAFGLPITMGRNVFRMLKNRIDGSYKKTPFFDTNSSQPVVQPRVLKATEYEQLMERC